jgi:prophage regulatory protein
MTKRRRKSNEQAITRESVPAFAVLPHSAWQPMRRTIRRTQLRAMVPLAATTIYDLEQRGEFPRRTAAVARFARQ